MARLDGFQYASSVEYGIKKRIILYAWDAIKISNAIGDQKFYGQLGNGLAHVLVIFLVGYHLGNSSRELFDLALRQSGDVRAATFDQVNAVLIL